MTTTTFPLPARRWVPRTEPETDRGAAAALERALGLPSAACRLLVARGYGDVAAARSFLRPRLDGLGDPHAMAGMDAAVERVERALRQGERILVHGDYDVDGICSAALLTRVLRRLGGKVEPFVPKRLRDGYDLGGAGISAAREVGATLILTADCGIAAHDAITTAAAAGIDVVVTDHHTPGAKLPDAAAVVNPNQADCAYPDKGLAGAGVAFKLCQALAEAGGLDRDELFWHLDLVALATIADLVPLTGENRILARAGLKIVPKTRNPGLRALLESAGLAEKDEVTAGQVGFILGPRLNAVGRMDDAAWGVRLLTTADETEAATIAGRLEAHNRHRREVDQRTLREALDLMDRQCDPERDRGVVLASAGWHPGVIGIVASRVVERIHRPTVLVALEADGSAARGSGRSIPGFNLYEALAACAAHLERFGGHKHAAGLDILPDRLDAFREAFNAHARAALDPEQLTAEVRVDLDLPLSAANEELHRLLRHFAPFGAGNPAPVFLARRVTSVGAPRVVGGGHLKLTLVQDGTRLDAVGFRMADRLGVLDFDGARLDVVYQLQENAWNGRTRLQAKLLDLRIAG